MKKANSLSSTKKDTSARTIFRYFLIALQFLTIIPLDFKKEAKIQDADIANSTVFFPLVGFIMGILLVCMYIILNRFFSLMLTSAFLVASWIFLSGALHVDGLADTIDGFCGGENREAILSIMKDACTGAKGVVGVALLVLIKFCLLTQILASFRPQVLMYVPVVARWGMLIQCYASPYARRQGMGMFSSYLTPYHIIFASLITVLIGFFLLGLFFLIMLGGVAFFSLGFSLYLKKKIGGFTGDTLGAVSELGEILALVIGVFA